MSVHDDDVLEVIRVAGNGHGELAVAVLEFTRTPTPLSALLQQPPEHRHDQPGTPSAPRTAAAPTSAVVGSGGSRKKNSSGAE